MEAADIRLSRELEGEKRLLKQMYAELSLENWILKEVLEKKTLEPVVKRQLVCRLVAAPGERALGGRGLTLRRSVHRNQPQPTLITSSNMKYSAEF